VDQDGDGVGAMIRPAMESDGHRLQEIEVRAGERFRGAGFPEVADDEPFSLEELARYARAGRSWVAISDGQVVGYVVVDDVDGNAHVEQVSVDPRHQGLGHGRALLDHVARWAADEGFTAITLTTFRDVAWNRPLYEHLGYHVLEEAEIGSELRALRRVEADHGLDPAQRVCMRLDLRPALPGEATLVASWTALAQLSPGARLVRTRHAAVAVFPSWAPLNNAIVLGNGSRAPSDAAGSVREHYVDAGISAWALWVPSRATVLDADDGRPPVVGMVRDTTTLVMEATLGDDLRRDHRVVPTSIAVATLAAGDAPVPANRLAGPGAVQGLTGWALVSGDHAVAGAWSFVDRSDCGIYTVGTVPGWRRRGLGRALVEHVLADAHDRGARTATLQSTRMGQPLYASLGFRAAGRYEEWTPGAIASGVAHRR
jgi:GNAT superfamily N-acetyltransferase